MNTVRTHLNTKEPSVFNTDELIHIARRTFRLDVLRHAFQGIIISGFMSFAVLVSIRFFDASDAAKSTVVAAESLGRLLSPLSLLLVARLRLQSARMVSVYMFLVAILFASTALSNGVQWYVWSMVLTYLFFAQPPVHMLHVYSTNYAPKTRGRKLGIAFIASTLMGSIFSFWGGGVLDANIGNFRFIFAAMGACALVCALVAWRMPSKVASEDPEAIHPLLSLRFAIKDKLFGWMVLAYMLLGIGNGIFIPLRIEYMANKDYGINASNLDIALVNFIVPALAIAASISVWGIIFDRLHFIKTRLLMNACFIASIVVFFSAETMPWFLVSAVLNGFAVAGGMIVWNLWVTKLAPKSKVDAYMSVHCSSSGLKGIIAPWIGFSVMSACGPDWASAIASGFFILSSLMFLILWNNKRLA